MISEAFKAFIIDMHGDPGRLWIEQLPETIEACAERWKLQSLRPAAQLTFNFVAMGERPDGEPVVLKIGFPHPELWTEMDALRDFNGRGAVRLLTTNGERNAMLLERVLPGDDLTSVADDEEATRIAARVMRNLWRPAPENHRYPSVADWGKGFGRLRKRFDGGTGPLPEVMVEKAEKLYADLLSDSDDPVLLHGDLHHMNVLRRGEEWVVIDPKGVIGEPAYETGALFRNPIPEVFSWPDLRSKTERRIAILSEELGVDRHRLRDWGIAQAVLSAWWDIEDSGNAGTQWITIAEALNSSQV